MGFGGCRQELEAARMIPEGALDRFKKQSRRLHAEPLKICQGLAHALERGAGLDIDEFRPASAPGPSLPPLSERKTLVITCDEDPKQRLACINKWASIVIVGLGRGPLSLTCGLVFETQDEGSEYPPV